MVQGMLGKKLGMTRIFTEDGRWIEVTLLEAGPCTVVQRKTQPAGIDPANESADRVFVHRPNLLASHPPTGQKTGNGSGGGHPGEAAPDPLTPDEIA